MVEKVLLIFESFFLFIAFHVPIGASTKYRCPIESLERMSQKCDNQVKEAAMKMKKHEKLDDFGEDLGVSTDRIGISKMKTKLKKTIIKEAELKNLSAQDLAQESGFSRTVISGILNGSLVSVSLERLIRLAVALDLSVEISIKNAA